MNLIKGLSMEKYEKGDLIYKQNDKPEYIYLIKAPSSSSIATTSIVQKSIIPASATVRDSLSFLPFKFKSILLNIFFDY